MKPLLPLVAVVALAGCAAQPDPNAFGAIADDVVSVNVQHYGAELDPVTYPFVEPNPDTLGGADLVRHWVYETVSEACQSGQRWEVMRDESLLLRKDDIVDAALLYVCPEHRGLVPSGRVAELERMAL